MTQPPRTPDDRWRNLMDGLADSVTGAPDEDVLEETRDAHGNPAGRAEEIRTAMLASIDEVEASEGERRILPFVPATHEDAPARRRALWIPAAAAAAALVVSAVSLAALWRPDASQVAVTPPSVVDTPPPVALPQPTPPVVPDADSAPPVEPAQRPAPTSLPRHRATPITGPGEPPPNTPPRVRTPDTDPPPIGLAKVRTVCVNYGLKTRSATASALREEIARNLGDGGQLTPIDDQQVADARLSITEAPSGYFVFLFKVDNRDIWFEPARVAGPEDVNATADRIAQKITTTVLDARQKAGASQ